MSRASLDALVAASARAGILLKRGAYQFGRWRMTRQRSIAWRAAMPGVHAVADARPARMTMRRTDMPDVSLPLGRTRTADRRACAFHTPFTNRGDWAQYNRVPIGRRRAHRGARARGVRAGSWGHTSPTYFASPNDQTRANTWMLEFAHAQGHAVRAFVAVNPNFTAHALHEIERGMAARGHRHQARCRPSRRRCAARRNCLGGGAVRRAGPASRLAASTSGLAQSGRLRWPRSRAARRAPSAGDVPAGPHRWRRRLGAYVSGRVRPAEHRDGPVGQRHRSRHDRRGASRRRCRSACCGPPT